MAVSTPAQETDRAVVSYARVGEAEGDLWRELRGVIAAGAKRLLDVGGGAKPVLFLPQIERLGLDYLVLDISLEQLQKAPAGYQLHHASITDAAAVEALLLERGPFDAIVSRWTAEHVREGRVFHEHIFRLLRPGGRAIHLFPTLYALPFLVNRVLPTRLSSEVLWCACPQRKGKFKPYYSWCRGPAHRQLARLESIGFSLVRYTGYYGHAFYQRVPPLAAAQRTFTRIMLAHPLAYMTSFALVVVERPA